MIDAREELGSLSEDGIILEDEGCENLMDPDAMVCRLGSKDADGWTEMDGRAEETLLSD